MADFMRDWGPLGDDEANRNAIEELRQVLHGGRAVAFVGAGAAAPRIPTWGDLIIRLTDILSKKLDAKHKGTLDACRKLAEDGDNLLGAATLLSTIAHANIPNALTTVFKSAMRGNRTTSVYCCLARLSFRGFVTTNYDSGLIEALSQKRRFHVKQTTPLERGVFEWMNDDVTIELPVMHLHGLPDKALVFGQSDYERHYNEPRVKRFLNNLFFRRLVFVGFGFQDPYFDQTFSDIYAPFEEFTDELIHFAIEGAEVGNDWTTRRNSLAGNYHAQTIFYPIRTKPRTGKDYGALVELLEFLKSPARQSPPSRAKSLNRSPTYRSLVEPPLSEAQLSERIAKAMATSDLPEFLLKLLFSSPKPVEWRVLLSCRQMQINPDDDDALKQADQILRTQTKALSATLIAWASIVIGLAHLRNNDVKAAEFFYKKACRIKSYPQKWEINHLGARLAMAQGNYELSAKRLDVPMGPGERDRHVNMEIRIERAWAALACGDIDMAYAKFDGMLRAYSTETEESHMAETTSKVIEAWGYWISSLYGVGVTKLMIGETTHPSQLFAEYQHSFNSIRYVFGGSLQSPLYPLALMAFRQPVKISNHHGPPEPLLRWWAEFRIAQAKKRYDVNFGKLEELTPITWLSTLAGLIFLARRPGGESSPSWEKLKTFLAGSTQLPRLAPLVTAYFTHIKKVFADREVPKFPGL